MKISAEYLRACVAAYLRYDRQCPVVAFERGGHSWERPDVLALTKTRHWIEVEIKTSIADFRADSKKRKWILGDRDFRQFYYLVPPDLVDEVKPMVRQGLGLLSLSSDSYGGLRIVKVVKPATVHPKAPRATARDMLRAVRAQSGTLCALSKSLVLKGEEEEAGRSARLVIRFSVQCEPTPQGRHRTVTHGKGGKPLPFPKRYVDEKSTNMRAILVAAAQEHRPPVPMECPLILFVTVRKMKPKSYARKRWAWTVTPDLDNFVKIIDCFNGILWRDDAQIIEIHARKEYAPTPGFDFQIEEATG